jgi:predicted Na+-dependent transporter
MQEIISSLTNAFTLAFVVTSMFSLGLSLTLGQILDALKDVRLVIMALIANFVIVPVVAYLLTLIFPLNEDLRIGILLMSLVAGAPLAIKAAQAAKGDMVFAGSLVALEVIVTVIYLPFVLPLVIPGTEVDTVALAMPLILQILLPLAFGLLMNARYDEEAEMTRPIMGEISNLSLALMIVLNLANLGQVFSLLGTGAILSSLIIIIAGVVVGYLLGGPDVRDRRTLAVGTGQRNYAAALTIATGSFADRPPVLVLLLAASLISMIVIMLIASEMGKRAKDEGTAEPVASKPAVAGSR